MLATLQNNRRSTCEADGHPGPRLKGFINTAVNLFNDAPEAWRRLINVRSKPLAVFPQMNENGRLRAQRAGPERQVLTALDVLRGACASFKSSGWSNV